ncbi:MAG: radical SAM protein [Marinilabiliales bacterium]|nr:MAG: radical SAM protein [Marinilabiliales bacterium]
MTKHYNIPIFIPELACPFQCAFCNQKKISGQEVVPEKEEIIHTIESHLSSFKETNREVNIAFFGGSFTGLPIKDIEYYLSLAQPYINTSRVNGIQISTRPDYIDLEILNLLKKYHVNTIELGAQSLDDDVLKKTYRGHTAKQVIEAAELIKSMDFKLGLQMMIGLPGDSLEKSIYTAKKIVELGADNTRIYPALVIKDTAMHTWYKKGSYKPLSLEQAIIQTKQILPIFQAAGVKVLRIGLHPSEGLLNGNELIDGPFHINFKEMVLSEIWADKLKGYFKKEADNIEIKVPKSSINYAIGYKAKNKKLLQKNYKSVSFIEDKSFSIKIY